MTTHLKESTNTTGVGDDAVASFGEHELCVLGGDAYVAQERTLERSTNRPALNRDDHGSIKIEQLLDALVAAGHEFVMGEARGVVANGTNVAT
ncbi:unannotated protein [freshwater metagenome]|uniref:Unannotated protein n=1 Tax=freshwater metagenome TaxID=449393 RepID=A0A6J6G5U5_9ZZZZ